MTLIATIREDMIVGRGTGTSGIEVPEHLENLSLLQLRWDGENIIDAATVTDWHIDAEGAKRLDPSPSRQPLSCSWDDELVQENGVWRVKTTKDDLIAYSARKRDEVLNQPVLTPSGLCWCDRGTRSDIAQAIQLYDENLLTGTIRFKLVNGFVQVDRAALVMMGGAIGARVQGAFDTMFDVVTEIEAGTITTEAQIDAADWPSNGV